MGNKYIYFFDEGSGSMVDSLGVKGVRLCEMTGINLPVPKGFIITREACEIYFTDRYKFYKEVVPEIMFGIKKLGKITGKRFGDNEEPLLVSVRPSFCGREEGTVFGIKEDPVINIGLNDDTLEGLAKQIDNEECAFVSCANLIKTLGCCVASGTCTNVLHLYNFHFQKITLT